MGKFKYQQRDAAAYDKRAHQSAGSRDEIISSQFRAFVPKEGTNLIRILPPTWKDADSFGYEVFVHYGIGVDKNQYLSLAKMKGIPDPIQEEKLRAEKNGDIEYSKQLTPTKRVLVWVIDRDKENEGPLLWTMPWTLERDLATRAKDKRTGKIYHLDDPEEGYDVSFNKVGKGQQTKYEAVDIARNSSPLHDDEKKQETWLDYIVANPLPSTLVYHDYDRIADVMAGHTKRQEGDDSRSGRDSRDDRSSRDSRDDSRSSRDDRDDSRSAPRREDRTRRPALPTYDELMEMEMDDLDGLCEKHDVELFADDFDDAESFAKAIAEKLEISAPRPSRREKEVEQTPANEDAPSDESPARRLRRASR